MAEEIGLQYKKGEQFPTLTSAQAASKMMEPTNASNPKFIQTQIMDGALSEDAISGSPPGVLKIAKRGRARTGSIPLGTGANTAKKFTPKARMKNFLPNPDNYEPKNSGKVSNSIGMGFFMGKNSQASLGPDVDRQQLTKNLGMQAEIIRIARSRPEFSGYMIECAEGVYKYEKLEKKTEGSMAAMSSVGQLIGYSMSTFDGKPAIRKLFALGEYIMESHFYDKVIMEYNSYSGAIDGRLFIQVPDMSGDPLGVSFKRQTATMFNGEEISSSLMLLDVFSSENGEAEGSHHH